MEHLAAPADLDRHGQVRHGLARVRVPDEQVLRRALRDPWSSTASPAARVKRGQSSCAASGVPDSVQAEQALTPIRLRPAVAKLLER
ncbi:MAG: hypothetical protein M5U28_38520 [Sandaracinaceae bacterium]|nr:hypothetical protein [Sandaracinaceae bacterium]